VARAVIKKTAYGLFRATGGVPSYALTVDGLFATSRKMAPPDYFNLMRGHYEGAERTILRGAFRNASTIVEIGSNIGVVASLALDSKLERNGRMICVEPNPDSHEALYANLSRAQKRRASDDIQLRVLHAAVSGPQGERGGSAEFIQRADLSSGLSGQVSGRASDSSLVNVEVTSLSSILNAHNVDGPYSLICDAEGAEIPLIFEDAAALKNCSQMLIELHSPSLTGREDVPPDIMVRELESLGFRLRVREHDTYYLDKLAFN